MSQAATKLAKAQSQAADGLALAEAVLQTHMKRWRYPDLLACKCDLCKLARTVKGG